MNLKFYLKRGDTAKSIRFAPPVQVPPAPPIAAARFQMRDRATGLSRIDAAAAVVGTWPAEELQYDWISGDTDLAGIHEAEFVLTYQDGRIETLPDLEFIEVIISEDV